MRNLLACGLITFGAMTPSWGALTLTLDFSGFGTSANWSALHNDAWDGSTTDGEKQAAAEAVIQAAADYWETAFAASTRDISQTIAVGWNAYGGNTLAFGSVSWEGSPDFIVKNGGLTWDNDGSSTFFVDLTPADNSEWTDSSFRTDDLGGGSINVERVFYDAGAGTAAGDHADMLSIAIHEIAHTLGFVSGYPRYDALDVGSDGDLDLTGGTEIAYSGGHHSYQLAVPEDPGFPNTGWSIGGGPYYPTVMGPLIYDGTRKLLTEVDIMTVGDMQALDNLNTNPTIPEPEPALIILFAVGIALIFRRRGDKRSII